MTTIRERLSHTIIRHSLWLSLLFHILFLLSFSLLIFTTPQPRPPLPSYLPAYTAQDSPPIKAEESALSAAQETKSAEKTKPDGLKKPEPTISENKQAERSQPKQRSRTKSQPIPLSDPANDETMTLIGDTKIIQPLIKILASSLSKHLYYPRSAAEFGLSGTVLVGFVLHPEGSVTDTRIVKSSGTGVLDDAATKAVHDMSPVGGVSQYVTKPEYLVVGIIFG